MNLAKSLFTIVTHPNLTRPRNSKGTWVSYTPSISGDDRSALISLQNTGNRSCRSRWVLAKLYMYLYNNMHGRKIKKFQERNHRLSNLKRILHMSWVLRKLFITCPQEKFISAHLQPYQILHCLHKFSMVCRLSI